MEENEFSPLGFQDLSQGPDMQGSNKQRGILGCVISMRGTVVDLNGFLARPSSP